MVLHGIVVWVWWISFVYCVLAGVAKLILGENEDQDDGRTGITPAWLNWLGLFFLVVSSVLLLLNF